MFRTNKQELTEQTELKVSRRNPANLAAVVKWLSDGARLLVIRSSVSITPIDIQFDRLVMSHWNKLQ